jgi:hypothetical protein
MKKSILIGTIISMTTIAGVYTQTSDTLNRTRYGLELSQFITGSGFASGTEIFITVIHNNKKNISLGLYFCPEFKKITGITVHHEMTLGRCTCRKRIVPYAFYNMIYRFTRTRVAMPNQENEWSYGLYKSLEHHLGMGLNVKIAKALQVKGALGYGVYFGSIKKPWAADPITGEVSGSNGFGAIAKIGFAYTF